MRYRGDGRSALEGVMLCLTGAARFRRLLSSILRRVSNLIVSAEIRPGVVVLAPMLQARHMLRPLGREETNLFWHPVNTCTGPDAQWDVPAGWSLRFHRAS